VASSGSLELLCKSAEKEGTLSERGIRRLKISIKVTDFKEQIFSWFQQIIKQYWHWYF
jgi:hypothetical protein